MNTDKGRLLYATGIDNSKLRSDAAESRNILASIGQTAMQESNRMDFAFGKIAKAAGGIFAMGQVKEFAKEIINVRGEIESLEISFNTLLGSDIKGSAMFKDIREFAVNTPMMMKDLASGAQTMLAFNIEAEKVMPILRAIGDISMGDAQKFNSLSLAFSQMSATGKLMGQDLLQMINAGFNPLSVISEKTGKSIGELKEDMEKGKITTEMVTDAFISATSAGGKFYGMLERQSHGVNGAISNLQGAIEDMFNDLGTAAQGTTVEIIGGATNIVKHYKEVGEILAVIVGTYGVYKAAVITNEALIQASVSAKSMAVLEAYDAEMAALSALIPQKEAEAQSSLQQAVAAGHITQEKASEIAMLRAEAQAQLESLVAAEAAAKARLMASQADVSAALKWEEEIKNKIAALEDEADALFESGDSIAFNAKQEEIAALKSELLEVQKERETAAEAANTAATEMNAASHQQNAIATTQDSAATVINTTQTSTNTGVTSALTIAKTKLIEVSRKLYAAIAAHPYALAAAAVAALAYGIYKLATYETEAEKAQKRLDEAVRECEGSIAAETIKIDVMFNRLRRAKEGTEAYKDAKQAILDQYGNYLNGLSAEIASLKDVEGAYNAVKDAALEAARARAMEAYVKEEGDKYSEQYQDSYDRLYDLIKKMKGKAFADAHKQTISDVLTGKSNWTQGFRKQFDKTEFTPGGSFGASTMYTSNALMDETNKARKSGKDYETTLKEAPARFGVTGESKKEPDKTPPPTKIPGSGKSGGNNKADIEQQNADMLATEAANRRKQEEEYAKQIIDQVKDSEFEIRQARIDAMKDGIDKEMAENKLNYDKLKEQNSRRERDMLDNLADQRIRKLEDNDPTIFKVKNKDGKLEEDPGKRDEKYREIRAKLTVEDLDPQQKKQLEEFGKIATQSYEQANKESLDKMLGEVLTYEQQRLKITEEYTRKRNDLYEKNEDGSIKTDENGNKIFRKGVTQGNLDELNRQETEALKAVDEQFASREETYQAWCEEIANLSLKQLNEVLAQAKKNLDEFEKSGTADSQQLAQARAKVTTAQTAVNKANAKNQTNPGKRTLKEWEDLYKTLNEVEKEFESMGDTVGGTIGEIVSECGQFASSTLQMINGIKILTQSSASAIDETGKIAAKSLSTMEKASVILTIVSAALQISMQIASLFNDDEKKQKEIEHLQERIDQLQWELDHQEIGKVQQQYGSAIERLSKALSESRQELAAGQSGWQRIITLTSRASRNQELMQKTAEKLAQAYGSMSYTADKALGADKYKQANEQLKNLAQQQILLQEQINAESSKKKSDSEQMKEWEQKIEELGQEAIELINGMVEDIIGDTSTGIAEELADAFIEAFQAGEDAAKAWGDKVNEIVADILKRMLISKFLEEPLGEIFDKYKAKWFKDGEFQGLDSVINSMQGFANDLNAVGTDFASIWENLPDSVKNMFTITSDAEREASQKGIAAADQDSIDELNGRATAIQSHTFSISENTKTILSTTQMILRSLMNIETETEGFGARLQRMENNIQEMTSTLDDISTKGLKLKP